MNQDNVKIVEIRDRATFIPALAVKMIPANPLQKLLFSEIGYRSLNHPCIILMSLATPWYASNASDKWPDGTRTMWNAHKWIEDNWDSIVDCQVIDVEYILKEVDKPCLSLRDERIKEVLDEAQTDEDKQLAAIALLAAGLISGPDYIAKYNTWKCHICKKVRHDEFISVATKTIGDDDSMLRNIRYCNDNPECEAKAKE